MNIEDITKYLPTWQEALKWSTEHPEIIITAIVSVMAYRILKSILWKIGFISRLVKKVTKMSIMGG
jgi:hypothetical protein